MKLSQEDRLDVEADLHHWGRVARKRWQCERKYIHPLVRAMETGLPAGPTVYTYEYEPDTWFTEVNNVVIRLPQAHREALVKRYILRKSWRMIAKELGLAKWWAAQKALRKAELMYLMGKEAHLFAKNSEYAILS